MGTWWPGANWESRPPSCSINGYLVKTGEANVKLSIHVSLMGEVQVGLRMPTPSPWGMAQLHLRGPPPGGFASMGSKCLSSAQASQCWSLGRRDCLAAARDFALLCVCVCGCMCVDVCVCVCVLSSASFIICYCMMYTLGNIVI